MAETKAMTPQEMEEELLSFLYTKQIHCPVCDKEFMDFMIRKSKLRATHTDTDFRTTYKTIDTNHYDVLFCYHCGYATLQNYFDRITERQQKMIREKITPHFRPMEFPMPLSLEHVSLRYKQALACADAIESKPSQKAFINLKLAWVLRGVKNKKLELKFLREAYEGLKKAFSTENFPLGQMDESTAKYVIGDLARRLGEMTDAMRWVGDVVIAKGIPSSLKERALNLKDLIREGKTD